MNPFNHAASGSLGGQQLSDLKVWEAIPVVQATSHLAQYLQPPNSDLSDLSNLNEYDLQGAGLYDEGGIGDHELSHEKPNLGGLLSGFHIGALRPHFPTHKLKKYLRHQHGLIGKYRGYGNYLGDLAHQLISTSVYQPHIPKLPFPISFPNLGSVGSYELEASIIQTILIPLAGVALLGAAATAMTVTNPFIWSLPFSLLLGPTAYGHIFGRRRRRNVDIGMDNQALKKKVEEIKILDDFLKKKSKAEIIIQEKKVLATYLVTQAVCLERLVCSLHRPMIPENMTQEGKVMNIVTNEILENEFVPQIIHDNILRARQVGLASGSCQTFFCQPLNYFAHHK
ncbi:hypothetical protein M8J75_011891 [Diaphorina citri]|nr:hypothetical protein M8J75_011891 [Diaphorina citri]KAI5752986.1 hypothetical protein M8J77_022461 [Diaphorina citri]